MPNSTAVFSPRQRVISETGLIAVNSTFATFDRQKLEINALTLRENNFAPNVRSFTSLMP